MELLIVYDVATSDSSGQRRLHRVAKICEGYGQRVQYSVFECTLNDAQFEQLQARLIDVIDPDHDSLRIYRLMQPRKQHVHELGRPLSNDLHDPLVL